MSIEETILHLGLLGEADPRLAEGLDAVEKRDQIVFPEALRVLLETWGPGKLFGTFELIDPSCPDDSVRWQSWRLLLEQELQKDVQERRYAADEWVLDGLHVFAEGDDGSALAWRFSTETGACEIWFLDAPDASGRVHWLASSLQEAIRRMLRERFRGDVADVFPPTPGGRWGFNPVFFGPSYEPPDFAGDFIAALVRADDDGARRVLDDALGIWSGYAVCQHLLEVLAPPLSELLVRVPYDIELDVHIGWLERALEMMSEYAPDMPLPYHVELVRTELATRNAPRIPFESDSVMEVSVRARDARYHKLLLLDITNPTEHMATGELRLLVYDSDGDLKSVMELAIEVHDGSTITLGVDAVERDARLDLEFDLDEVVI